MDKWNNKTDDEIKPEVESLCVTSMDQIRNAIEAMTPDERLWKVWKGRSLVKPCLHTRVKMYFGMKAQCRISIIISDLRSNKTEEFKKWNNGCQNGFEIRFANVGRKFGMVDFNYKVFNKEINENLGYETELETEDLYWVFQVDASLMEYFSQFLENQNKLEECMDKTLDECCDFLRRRYKSDYCFTGHWAVTDNGIIREQAMAKQFWYKINVPPQIPPPIAKKRPSQTQPHSVPAKKRPALPLPPPHAPAPIEFKPDETFIYKSVDGNINLIIHNFFN